MLTIGWDVDDVLNNLMRDWLNKEWLPKHAGCHLKYQDIKINPPHKLLSVTRNEYLESLDSFRLTKLYRKMKPVKDVLEWFRSHGTSYRHIAITSVPKIAASSSAGWVFNNFGEWIRTFHFVPSRREGQNIPQYDNDKAGYLKWLNKVDIFVDDNEENIKGAQILGIKCILCPRPWNTGAGSISELLKPYD